MSELRQAFERTVCGCIKCQAGCRHIPGALAPEDVAPILAKTGKPAEEILRASEGARVFSRVLGLIDIPSLVPASRADGSCVFFEEGQCTIHAVAPFSCAYYDTHMGEEDATERTHALVTAQAASTEYQTLIYRLAEAGHVAPSREARKRAYHAALDVLEATECHDATRSLGES